MKKYQYEDVDGAIIGDITFQFALVNCTTGNKEFKTYQKAGFDGAAWAEDKLSELKQTVLGDGKTFNEHPSLFKSIYGVKGFELREYTA